MKNLLERFFYKISHFLRVTIMDDVLLLVGLIFTWNPNFTLDLTFFEFISMQDTTK